MSDKRVLDRLLEEIEAGQNKTLNWELEEFRVSLTKENFDDLSKEISLLKEEKQRIVKKINGLSHKRMNLAASVVSDFLSKNSGINAFHIIPLDVVQKLAVKISKIY